jgi:hypothetical protein
MRNQKRNDDGLVWVAKLFRPTWWKTLIYHMVSPFMLEKDSKAMGRGVRRMPFRKALKRDVWEQSDEAIAVGNGWDEARKGGGKTSFAEDSDSPSVPDS